MHVERVLDWKARIAGFSYDIQKVYQIGLSKMKHVKDLLLETKNWDTRIKSDILTCEQKVYQNHVISRARAIQEVDVLTTFRSYNNIDNRLQCDKNLQKL